MAPIDDSTSDESTNKIMVATLLINLVGTFIFVGFNTDNEFKPCMYLHTNELPVDIIIGFYGFLYAFGGFQMMVINPIYSIVFGSLSGIIHLVFIKTILKFNPKIQLPLLIIFSYAFVYRLINAFFEEPEYYNINAMLQSILTSFDNPLAYENHQPSPNDRYYDMY